MISWCLSMRDSPKEVFLCLSSLGRFLNKAVIKQIQEDQFTCVIWSQKVSDELS